MRNPFYKLVLAGIFLLAAIPISSQTIKTWTGADPADVAYQLSDYNTKATEEHKKSDNGRIYLYNVGRKEYINFGGAWGMQPTLHEVGAPLYLETGSETASGGTYYKIGTNTYSAGKIAYQGYIGYLRPVDKGSDTDPDVHLLMMDPYGTAISGHDGVVRMRFSEVPGKDNVYYINFRNYERTRWGNTYFYSHDSNGNWSSSPTDYRETRYLSVGGKDGDKVVGAYTTSEHTIAGNEDAQWMIVTMAEMKEKFDLVDKSSTSEVAEATFMLDDQNFSRNSSFHSSWKRNGVTYFGTDVPSKNTTTTTEGTANGTDDTRKYGQFWSAILIDDAEIYQEIEAPKSGWYEFSVKGISTGKSDAADDNFKTAILYSEITNQSAGAIRNPRNESKALPDRQFTGDTIPIQANRQFKSNATKYEVTTSILVYVTKGETIRFGVKGTDESGWTIIDDVQLKYTSGAPELVLDENWGQTGNYKDTITTQVDSLSSVFFFKRTFSLNKWNSIVMPMNLSVQQIREVFGCTKLSKLSGTGRLGADIYFESVDLEIDETNPEKLGSRVGIEAGQLYIMVPTKAPNYMTDLSYLLRGANDGVKRTLEKPYYGFKKVLYDTEPESMVVNGAVKGETAEGTRDNGIFMQGTYLAGHTIPAYSYAISATDGEWYYLRYGVAKSKGYRGWIRTEGYGTAPNGTKANLFIDDVQITDGIEGLEAELPQVATGAVYTLGGQLVNKRGSLDGLPKGIYVRDGKKYVVK